MAAVARPARFGRFVGAVHRDAPGNRFGRVGVTRLEFSFVARCETGRCGRSAAGSASPCQGEGRGFESRRPLGGRQESRGDTSVEWPRGEATACKAVYTGSNPVSTSTRVHGVGHG